PAVKNKAWVRNPIDFFVLAELEKRGLTPAPEADRRTIARRLSLDLIGLPPQPWEVEAFVNDTRPDAYERFVDYLLESPHWGEHRGRTGWTRLATPIRTVSTSTTTARCGRTATGSSTPSTRTCRSTSLRSINLRATCFPSARSISKLRRVSIAATSLPTRAARSTRSTWSSTRATA